MLKKNQIIVALDGISTDKALRIAKLLKGRAWGFKVNDLLFDSVSIIKRLKNFGNVFADAKLYDIPNTVANSVARLSNAGADMITVHAAGGKEMMQAAVSKAGKSKIIAVTVLTSFLNTKETISQVLQYAKQAQASGAHGIVCSGHELASLKKIKLLKIVPGIRPDWYGKKDDQKRTMTPKEAIERGADFLVIGRPITEAKDPRGAIQKIITTI